MADADDNPRHSDESKGSRRSIDWEAVEREYRTGQLSVREIGKQFDVSRTAIAKRAESGGWTRDLMGQVRRRSNEILALPTSASYSPEQIGKAIEDGAARVADIVRSHRNQIGTARAVVQEALNDLGALGSHHPLAARASVLQVLSTAMKNLIALERQAFNMDAVEPEKPLTSENLTPERRKAALALLLARENPAAAAVGVRW